MAELAQLYKNILDKRNKYFSEKKENTQNI